MVYVRLTPRLNVTSDNKWPITQVSLAVTSQSKYFHHLDVIDRWT